MTSDELLLISQNDHVHIKIIVLIPENENSDELSKAEILAVFRQAWYEAMTGKIIVLSQIWEFLAN
jgi:hypothetical protein